MNECSSNLWRIGRHRRLIWGLHKLNCLPSVTKVLESQHRRLIFFHGRYAGAIGYPSPPLKIRFDHGVLERVPWIHNCHHGAQCEFEEYRARCHGFP